MLLSELLAGLIAKLAGLGLASKAAMGLGLASAAVTGAGAAGVLPEPAQHAVATVVKAVSPLQLPDPTEAVELDTDVDDPTGLVGNGTDLVTDDPADDLTEGPKVNHGACVSAVAHDRSVAGREHGQAVSAAARSDCGKPSTSTSSTSTSSTTTIEDSAITPLSDDGNRGKANSGRGGSSGKSGSSPGRGSGPGGSLGKSGK